MGDKKSEDRFLNSGRIGYWSIPDGNPGNPKCSKCGGSPYYSKSIRDYRFCPYCGACMVDIEIEVVDS